MSRWASALCLYLKVCSSALNIKDLHQEPESTLLRLTGDRVDRTLNMLSVVQLLIQSTQHYPHDDRHDNGQSRCRAINAERYRQTRLRAALGLRVHVTRIDTARIRNCIDECKRCSTFGRRTRHRVRDPGPQRSQYTHQEPSTLWLGIWVLWCGWLRPG